MEATVMPLPIELTTPPVTKTYLVAIIRPICPDYMGSLWRIHVPADNNAGQLCIQEGNTRDPREGSSEALFETWILCWLHFVYVKGGVSLGFKVWLKVGLRIRLVRASGAV